MGLKRTLKICLLAGLLVVLVPTVVIVIAGAVFLQGLEFGPMEPTRVVDTLARSPAFPELRGEPRLAAEWEPALGALVRWPLIVPESLVVEIARDDTLFLLVEDEKGRAEAEAALVEWGVDLESVQFITAPQGGAHPWTRDWGPSARFSEKEGYSLADPWFDDYPLTEVGCQSRLYSQRRLFFRDFTNDDRATDVIADTLGFANTRLPIALTGGNALVDGFGTVFSTCAMLNENRALGVSENQFFAAVRQQAGVSRYVVIPNFELFGIQHIDCFLKLLDEERILVARPPQGHSHSERAEAIVRELSSLTNVHGRPYQILRIDTPPYWRDFMPAYTNSLILNRKILVPLYGIPADQDALEAWRKAMPGYRVIGFEHDGHWLDQWMWFDAIHCRVRAIWDPEMLYMAHRRIDRTVAPEKSFPIEVRIVDHSRAGLIPEALQLSWRSSGEERWRVIPLEATARPETFVASIPGADADRGVEYFLSAADRSGRRESLPRTAPGGYYSFRAVLDENTP
jgi:agmatine/peptidylarginine deiminase